MIEFNCDEKLVRGPKGEWSNYFKGVSYFYLPNMPEVTETSIPKGAIRRCEIQGRNDTGENWRTDTEMIPKHDNLIGG